MNIEPQALENLFEIQQCMLASAKAKRALEELPQRQTILQLRQKKAQVEQKKKQVEALLAQAKQELSRISDDDERMANRQVDKQKEIENASASGNFRAVENLSKELDTIAKKRTTLSQKNDAAVAQLEKVESVNKQVLAALASLAANEEKEIASFQQQGGKLQKEIAENDAHIKALSAGVPANVLAEFKKIATRTGGVALGKLSEGRCGCCRASIDAAHLAQMRTQAPLSTCPSCRRLLVI